MRKKREFTLIELLIVVAMFGILLSLLLPSLRRARDMAKRAVCASNMAQMHRNTMLYIHDYDNSFIQFHDPGRFVHPAVGTDEADMLLPYDGREMTIAETMSDNKDSTMHDIYKCPDHNRPGFAMRSYGLSLFLGAKDSYPDPGLTSHFQDNKPTKIMEINDASENIMFMESWTLHRINPRLAGGAILGRHNGSMVGPVSTRSMLNSGDSNVDRFHGGKRFYTNFTFSDGHYKFMSFNDTYSPLSGVPAVYNGSQSWKAVHSRTSFTKWDY